MLSNRSTHAVTKSSDIMPKQGSQTRSSDQQSKLPPIVAIQTDIAPKLEEIRVDMARMKVESRPVELLTSVGSCVAICLYDSTNRCGGLAHIMLPTSPARSLESLPSKFADTAVPTLAKKIGNLSGKNISLSAKIAGGANMFANFGNNNLDIGSKNVKAVKIALEKDNIRLMGEDVGGTHGRRISFNAASGVVTVRHHNGETKRL